jgi:hypothetical protein
MSFIKPQDFIKVIIKIADSFALTRLQNSCDEWIYEFPFVNRNGAYTIVPKEALSNLNITLVKTPKLKAMNFYSVKFNKQFEKYIQIISIQMFEELSISSDKGIHEFVKHINEVNGLLKFVLDDNNTFIDQQDEELYQQIEKNHYQYKLIHIKEMIITTKIQIVRSDDEFVTFAANLVLKFIYVLSRFIYNYIRTSTQAISLFEFDISIKLLDNFHIINLTDNTRNRISDLFSEINNTKKIRILTTPLRVKGSSKSATSSFVSTSSTSPVPPPVTHIKQPAIKEETKITPEPVEQVSEEENDTETNENATQFPINLLPENRSMNIPRPRELEEPVDPIIARAKEISRLLQALEPSDTEEECDDEEDEDEDEEDEEDDDDDDTVKPIPRNK